MAGYGVGYLSGDFGGGECAFEFIGSYEYVGHAVVELIAQNYCFLEKNLTFVEKKEMYGYGKV